MMTSLVERKKKGFDESHLKPKGSVFVY